jgi:hypothetical protein
VRIPRILFVVMLAFVAGSLAFAIVIGALAR